MKKYYTQEDNNEMKLLLSNYYCLVNIQTQSDKKNCKMKHYKMINNVILPRYCQRDYAPYMTTYTMDYNPPRFYKNLLELKR